MLRLYRDFARAYINDILIFSDALDAYYDYLRQIFRILELKNVLLSPSKSKIGYPSLNILG